MLRVRVLVLLLIFFGVFSCVQCSIELNYKDDGCPENMHPDEENDIFCVYYFFHTIYKDDDANKRLENAKQVNSFSHREKFEYYTKYYFFSDEYRCHDDTLVRASCPENYVRVAEKCDVKCIGAESGIKEFYPVFKVVDEDMERLLNDNITAEESEKMKDLRTATGCRKNVPGCTLLPLFNEPGSDAPPGQSGRFLSQFHNRFMWAHSMEIERVGLALTCIFYIGYYEFKDASYVTERNSTDGTYFIKKIPPKNLFYGKYGIAALNYLHPDCLRKQCDLTKRVGVFDADHILLDRDRLYILIRQDPIMAPATQENNSD